MERKITNPWTWQDSLGFVQATEVSGGERVLYCAGQTSVDADGAPLHVDDMAGQIGKSFDNLETVLSQAGYDLSDVMRINYYVTDVGAFVAAGQVTGKRLADGGCRPASTLLGVESLAFPELLVEIEATAVK